ncbi:MAG TPA: hypothetical protein VJ821_10365 [Anaerolineales bacterium]|nr:hypothetical protein [Anaerolineales bacterium]
MNTDTPLVCNMNVFSPAQRDAHIQATTELIQAIQSVQQVENGYQLHFPNETQSITKIAAFISNERLCCPFLKFDLHIISNDEPLSLSLTGPIGTQEFLRDEFGGAIP